MKDYQRLINRAMAVCDSINERFGYKVIDYNKDTKWELADLKRCWGLTKRVYQPAFCGLKESTTYTIQIAECLMQDNVSDTSVLNTMIHELLHTCPNGAGHKGDWKYMADLVNRYYPEYDIKRCSSNAEKGVSAVDKNYKYLFQCEGCSAVIGRHRASDFTKHPERYNCAKCGKKFKQITKEQLLVAA